VCAQGGPGGRKTRRGEGRGGKREGPALGLN